ncbi:hypothetical protein FACS189418_6690 [Clostridia bacterium]|nr:hypothetical protein FACS189418_6690 [Clostridia bacterium]
MTKILIIFNILALWFSGISTPYGTYSVLIPKNIEYYTSSAATTTVIPAKDLVFSAEKAVDTSNRETEFLILNSVIYTIAFDSLNLEEKNQQYNKYSIYQWANEFDIETVQENPTTMGFTRQDFQYVVQTILNHPEVYQQMFIIDIDNEQPGNVEATNHVIYTTIEYGDELIIAFKGTAGVVEWLDNGHGAELTVTDTPQQERALAYFDRVFPLYGEGKTIYLTGYSKGGNKAQYVGTLRGTYIEHVYAYNAQGFSGAFCEKYKQEIEAHSDKFTNICNDWDFVSTLLNPIAKERRYVLAYATPKPADDTSTFDKALGVFLANTHAAYSLFAPPDENDNLVLSQTALRPSFFMEKIHGFMSYAEKKMSEEDWHFFIYSILSFMNPKVKTEIKNTANLTLPDDFQERFVIHVTDYLQYPGLSDDTVRTVLTRLVDLIPFGTYAKIPN